MTISDFVEKKKKSYRYLILFHDGVPNIRFVAQIDQRFFTVVFIQFFSLYIVRYQANFFVVHE